jgi:hypothetical protein
VAEIAALDVAGVTTPIIDDPRIGITLRTTTTAITALLVAAAIGLAGCTTEAATREPVESSAPPTNTAESDQNAEHNATIEAFISPAFNDQFEQALQHASPGSPAERYVAHQQAYATALNANGDAPVDDPATETDDAPTLTFDEGVVNVVAGGEKYSLTDFTFDENGLVTAWTGKSGPVADVLWTQPWSGQTGGNTVDLVSAYKANAGQLIVVIKVTANERAATVFGYNATYAASDGITYAASGSSQPSQITAGSAGYTILIFSGAPFGGTVNLEGSSPDDYSASWSAAIPVS